MPLPGSPSIPRNTLSSVPKMEASCWAVIRWATYEKVSSVPTASVGTANSTLGDFKAMSNNANQGGGMGSEGDQAKLAILEEMLAKEHMKQSLFPGDQDPAESA